MIYWSFVLPALEELVEDVEAERRATNEAWLDQIKDFHWVANMITLADFLGLCMNVSLKMQIVTVLPRELLETEDGFVKALDFIHAELRAKKRIFTEILSIISCSR
jgi:dsDNA-specific endonuclease/ATPase MutS2